MSDELKAQIAPGPKGPWRSDQSKDGVFDWSPVVEMYAARIEELERERDELKEEIATWQSVFPPITWAAKRST